MFKLIKFRFFLVLLILSCGDTPKKEVRTTSNENSVENALTSNEKIILFFGDSLTAGYKLDTQEAFPALIQDKIDSLQLNYKVINSGVSGETSSGGLNRISWVLNQKIDVFVLELGANDGLRGIPLKETKKNLQAIIDLVKSKNEDCKIILAGMQLPPNMGTEYITEFRKIFPDLAAKNTTALIPFLLENVAGIPDLNLEDGIHPNVEGQKIVRDNVWVILKNVL